MTDPNTRAAILEEAAQIVTKDRNATHGEPEDSFHWIARYWSVKLSQMTGHEITLEPWQVSILMTDLKDARIIANPYHRDSWIDKVGYPVCGASIALREARDGGAD